MFDNTYKVAKEGDKIVVSSIDGYELKAVYNGTEKVAVEKNADGKYVIEVPKGGGVLISADVAKITSGENNVDSETAATATTASNTANTTTTVTTPSTGDNSNLGLCFVSMGIAAVVATTSVFVIKKNNEA